MRLMGGFFARPYRSAWRNLGWNLRHVPYFLRTWWAYKGVLWHDDDGDHSSIWRLLEFKLRRLGACVAGGYHVGKERDVRRILVAAALCRRLAKEDYCFRFPHDPAPRYDTIAWEHTEYLHAQDLRYVLMLLGKYSRQWWT